MLNPYLVYIRLAVFLILLTVLGVLAYKVHSWRQDSLALDSVRQEMADLQSAQAASHAVSKGLQDELQDLRAARKPAPDVRLCRSAKKMPSAGTGRNDPPTGTGDIQTEDGSHPRNVGPDLYGLADEADELAARLRACQALLK